VLKCEKLQGSLNSKDQLKRRKAMTTIMPKGENVRQALKWISSERLDDEEKDLGILIGDACIRFNLSPKDEDFLRCFYSNQNP
jgi:hypothetical protein